MAGCLTRHLGELAEGKTAEQEDLRASLTEWSFGAAERRPTKTKCSLSPTPLAPALPYPHLSLRIQVLVRTRGAWPPGY
eukprot:6173240-Pleurochrysis_carterae.AAC.1